MYSLRYKTSHMAWLSLLIRCNVVTFFSFYLSDCRLDPSNIIDVLFIVQIYVWTYKICVFNFSSNILIYDDSYINKLFLSIFRAGLLPKPTSMIRQYFNKNVSNWIWLGRKSHRNRFYITFFLVDLVTGCRSSLILSKRNFLYKVLMTSFNF